MLNHWLCKLKIVAVVVTISVVSCSKRVNPNAPNAAGASALYAPEVSVINIPVEIPNQLLEDSLNAKIKGVIYDDQSYDLPDKDDVKLKVTVSGRIRTATVNDIFYSSIPLKIWAQARYEACSVCPTIEKETNFETIVYFSTKLSVSKDYRLLTTTESKGFSWVVEPKIYIAGIGISIKSTVEKQLDKTLKASAKDIDKNISNGFDLKSNAIGIWNQLYQPMLVDSTTQTWLKVNPVGFFMSPIKGSLKSLKLNMGVKAYIETYTGLLPEVSKPIPLPNLQIDAPEDNSFSVNLTGQITFAEATNIANRSIAGQSYQIGKKSVQVDSMKLSGLDNRLLVKTWLSKAIKGTVYLSAKPDYDVSNARLQMKDVDFDINTKNVLHKSAAWMIDGLFSKQLEKKLVFQVGEQLDSVKTQLNKQLASYQYQNLFTLKGNLKILEVKGVFIEPEGIKVALSAKGTAIISVGTAGIITPPKKK